MSEVLLGIGMLVVFGWVFWLQHKADRELRDQMDRILEALREPTWTTFAPGDVFGTDENGVVRNFTAEQDGNIRSANEDAVTTNAWLAYLRDCARDKKSREASE